MKFSNLKSRTFVPGNGDLSDAMERTTHLSIGAHQDDTEIMAYNGIQECFGLEDKWFASVTVTDGAGSARTGIYEKYSDEDMKEIRAIEQEKAAVIGEYSFQVQLAHPSSVVKDSGTRDVVEDLKAIFEGATPEVVYLHNPADKHDTHVATMLRALAALRELPMRKRPAKVYGCEVWRDLDWLSDNEKVAMGCDKYSSVSAALVGVFDSQISGGKRYDLATAGRRLANATYHDSHSVDRCEAMAFAVNLTPLIKDDSLSVSDYICSAIDRFRNDVEGKIDRLY